MGFLPQSEPPITTKSTRSGEQPKHLQLAGSRYALYRRVSTSMQAERDLSLPEQQAQQHEYVTGVGGIIANEYEDSGISGTSADARPAFLEMIAAAKRGEIDVILVHKSDRVFRNKDEASTYRILTSKLKVQWASVTEAFFGSPEPTDKLLTGIMESVNEFYVDNLKTEVRKGLRSAAVHKGRQQGSPPYGYRWKNLGERGSGWELDPIHSVWLQKLFRQFAIGDLTQCGLTQWANSIGMPLPVTRIPRKLSFGWNYQTLKRMLKNKVYLGLIQFNGEWLPGAHPPLVTEDVFNTVQSIFSRRIGRREDASGAGIALFSGGFLRCPHCWAAGHQDVSLLIRGTGRYDGAAGTCVPYITYSCRAYETRIKAQREGSHWNGIVCPGFSISETRVRKLLFDRLAAGEQAADAEGHVDPLFLLTESPFSENPLIDTATHIAELKKELSKIDVLREGYHTQAALGYMDLERLGSLLAKLDLQKAKLEEALISTAEPHKQKRVPVKRAETLLAFLSDPHMSLLEKRDVLHARFDSMIIHPDKNYFVLNIRESWVRDSNYSQWWLDHCEELFGDYGDQSQGQGDADDAKYNELMGNS